MKIFERDQEILDFKYGSQFGELASYPSDCGPTNVYMAARTKGYKTTVNKIFEDMKINLYGFTTISQLIKSLRSFEISSWMIWQADFEKIKIELKKGNPMILLIGYQNLEKENPYTNFKGNHFIMIVGYHGKDIYYHDPLWHNEKQGAYRRMDYEEFRKNVWMKASEIPGTALVLNMGITRRVLFFMHKIRKKIQEIKNKRMEK